MFSKRRPFGAWAVIGRSSFIFKTPAETLFIGYSRDSHFGYTMNIVNSVILHIQCHLSDILQIKGLEIPYSSSHEIHVMLLKL